jgi:hypothetical protein
MSFSGEVEAEWLPDGVNMRLLSPISYTDRNGRVWSAPAGFVTDGASIPQEFWSLIGSPFTGKYRTAAVLHDAAYRTLGVTKDDADLMLRDASLELGCPHWIAEALYTGVRFGGVDAYAADQVGNISPN